MSDAWTQYYFATERGERGYNEYRRDFGKLIWTLASPKWQFDEATFDRTARSFDNPDHVRIAINLPQEAPRAFAEAVIDVDRL